MSTPFYGKTKHLLGADTSNLTSPNIFIGDFSRIALSIETGSAFASRITVQVSNLDGFQSTLSSGGGFGNSTVPVGGWSHYTVILPVAAANMFTLTPGPRWMNVIRSTQVSGQTASNVTIILHAHT